LLIANVGGSDAQRAREMMFLVTAVRVPFENGGDLRAPLWTLGHGRQKFKFEDDAGNAERDVARRRICAPSRRSEPQRRPGPGSIFMAGRVKLTSGKTWPAPMVKPRPQASGCGLDTIQSWSGRGMASVEYLRRVSVIITYATARRLLTRPTAPLAFSL
jgi:hypothetical protein